MRQISREESGRVLRIEGDLEIGAANELHRALREFVAQAPQVIFDLSAVESCDTASLQLLCSAAKTAERAGKEFEFVALSPAIADAAAVLGLPISGLITRRGADRAQGVIIAPGENGGSADAL